MSGVFRVAVLMALAFSFGIARADDVVKYRDPGKKGENTMRGTITDEGPVGITVKPSLGKAVDIPATDIVDVQYQLPGRFRLDYLSASTEERSADLADAGDRKKQLQNARKLYTEMLAGVSALPAKRYLRFKVAELTARLAEGDPAQRSVAVERLKDFQKDNPDCWEITACRRALAELLAAQHDYEGAQKAYESLAAVRHIPAAVKQDCALRTADLLVRQRKYAEAKTRIEKLIQSTPADSPQLARLKISLAECQAADGQMETAIKALDGMIRQPLDNELKARAYNALGDCYAHNEKWQDALWNYLYVDVIYHQSREEHAKALYHLDQVFHKLRDDKKAAQFHKRLLSKDFAGTEYQKRLALESK